MDSTSSLTLDKCVQMALRNNADINNAAFQSSVNSVTFSQSKAAIFPSVSGSVGHSINSGRTINPSNNSYSTQSYTSADYSLNANMTLWNGFKLQNYIRKYALDNQAGQMDLQNQRDQITLQVIVAYLDVLNQEDLLENYKQQALSTQAQLSRLDSMDNAGAAKPDDLANMKGQLSGNQIAIISQEDAIKTAKITLFNLMNVALNMDAILERPQSLTEIQIAPSEPIDDIYTRALQHLPSIKSAELKQQSAYKYVQINKADYYPSLQYGASLGTNYSSTSLDAMNNKIGYFNQFKNNYGTSLGLTLNVPVFNGLLTRSNVKIAKIQAAQATFTTKRIKNQLKSTVAQQSFDVDAALKAWGKQQQQVDAYKDVLRVSQIKFNEGAINSTDYLIAKTQLQQAEINLIVDKYTYIFKSKILSYYQGDLSF